MEKFENSFEKNKAFVKERVVAMPCEKPLQGEKEKYHHYTQGME